MKEPCMRIAYVTLLEIFSFSLAFISLFCDLYIINIAPIKSGHYITDTQTFTLGFYKYSCDDNVQYYSETPSSYCYPVLLPGSSSLNNIVYDFKFCLFFLICGISFQFVSWIFKIILNCNKSCKNLFAKAFSVLISLVPLTCYAVSLLSIYFRITDDFNITMAPFCQLYWCKSFMGSSDGSYWGPSSSYYLLIVAIGLSVLSLLFTFIRKLQSNRIGNHHNYTKLENQT